MLTTLFIFISIILFIATLLPMSYLRHWWVRGLDFPRLQIASALAAMSLLHILWMVQAGTESAPPFFFLAALLACLGYQLYWIAPYSEVHAVEVLQATAREQSASPRFRLITCNVLMDNRNPGRLIELVNQEQPDLLLTLETDAWWQKHLDTLEDYPHRMACPLDNKYGMHVYSRLPLHDGVIDFLVEDDIPSMAVFVELEDGTRIRFHAVHPTPPAPGENDRSTERDVELLKVARRLEHNEDVTIVTGDLNDVAWSRTTQLFRDRGRLLDPRVGRGMFNTFHADYWFFRWPLDHVFVSSHWRLVEMRRLPTIESDHFPVLVELAVSTTKELDSHPGEEAIDHELEQDTLQTNVGQQATRPSLRDGTALA